MLVSLAKALMGWVIVVSSLVSWSLNDWFAIWLVMEVNVIFMVGIISMGGSYESTSVVIKYFLINLLISLMFLAFNLLFIFNLTLLAENVAVVMLLAKLGLAPFHFWGLSVVGKMDNWSFFIINTVFKLPAFSLLSHSIEIFFLFPLLVASLLAGAWLGLGNLGVQKVLMHSSVMNLCWLLFSMCVGINSFWLYFCSYMFTLYLLIYLLSSLGAFYLNQAKLGAPNYLINFCYLFVVLGLGGFPPFLGFVVKIVVVSHMQSLGLIFMSYCLIFIPILSVGYYFQFMYFILLVSGVAPSWWCSQFLGRTLLWLIFVSCCFYFLCYFCI